MIHHVVLFSWKSPMSAEEVAAVGRALDGMVAEMPYVRSYHHGIDAGLKESGNADYGIVATFDNADDWRKYDTDDVHNKVRAEVFAPIVGARTVIQFSS
jgi:hypothetical protein